MRSLLILLTAAAILTAPQAGGQGKGPQANSSESSVIEGWVLNAVTSEPLRKVELILRRSDMSPNEHSPTSYKASTDESGRFFVRNIEPGQYRLLATRSGFVSMEYGSAGPAQSGVTLSIEARRPMRDLVFRLPPHAVIAGVVRDVDGEPVANVQVQAMRHRYAQGQKQLSSFGRATTDDLGEYRIIGLAPGHYYLSASHRPQILFVSSPDNPDFQSPAEDYVPTYFPGTADAALAVPIEVTTGAEIRNIDFALAKAPTVRVHGRVMSSNGGSPGMATIVIAPTDQSSAWAANQTFLTNPQGEFDLPGVTPGTYALVASIFQSGSYTTAKKLLDARNSVEDFTVTLNSGVEINGTVRAEGAAQPNLKSVRVSLLPSERREVLAPLPNTQVKEDGTFTLSNVRPDSYHLTAFELPDGYYVKSIRMGDEDVLDSGLKLNGGSTGPISIALSPGTGEIAGIVQNAQQQVAIGAIVTLVPRDGKRRNQVQYYRTVTTDQYGRFLCATWCLARMSFSPSKISTSTRTLRKPSKAAVSRW